MTNLYISLFNSSRQKEFYTCVENNLKVFDNVIILKEGEFNLPDYDVTILPVSCRPTFRTFFRAINHLTNPNDINVIANSDIYFKEKPIAPKVNQCFALTRWEGDRFLNMADSQDVWAFLGQVKIPRYCDFHIGIRGCDNRVAYELKINGYEVLNPSLTIKTYHLHSVPTDHHATGKLVHTPYFKPIPCTL